MAKPKSVKPDGQAKNPKLSEKYEKCLRSSAIAHIKAFELMKETGDKNLSMNRLLAAVPQYAIEHGRGDLRYENSRWRHVSVDPSDLPSSVHVEHPFRKGITKEIVYDTWKLLNESGLEREQIIEKLKKILDTRSDTVLMPSMSLKKFGVTGNGSKKSDMTDGWDRYKKLIEAGQIIDRTTGKVATELDLKTQD